MTQPRLPAGVAVHAPLEPRFDEILTTEALELLATLHRRFEPRRRALLAARTTRQARIDAALVRALIPQELERVKALVAGRGEPTGTYDEAARVFERLAFSEEFTEFLTLPLYEALNG